MSGLDNIVEEIRNQSKQEAENAIPVIKNEERREGQNG